MNRLRLVGFVAGALLATACATPPPMAIDVMPYDEEPFQYPTPAAPMMQHPAAEPIQPAEPPEPEPPAITQPPSTPAPAPAEVAPAQPAIPSPSSAAPEIATEDHVLVALVGDLARYTTLNGDDVKKELNSTTQTLVKQRTDANRVRLAMLYTLMHSAQDDQRALQLLESVMKNSASPALKQLAGVIQVQITERLRAVREEQQKAEAAVQKLERLRELERNLLRDRLRSGGGGGGGGGSGGGR